MRAGALFADALAMPGHWYYDREALRRDYGELTDFRDPLPVHPDSILWRSHYAALNERGDILHGQAKYWGQRGVHYHQGLKAGENTLNFQLLRVLDESLSACGGYDLDDWLERDTAFMLTDGSHGDTYVEEYHRHFFVDFIQGFANAFKLLRVIGVFCAVDGAKNEAVRSKIKLLYNRCNCFCFLLVVKYRIVHHISRLFNLASERECDV
jgi:hypothetical protein